MAQKYTICTVKELVDMLAKEMPEDRLDFVKFPEVCFSIIESSQKNDEPEVVASGAEGWYGIHRIDTEFDDDELTLCANYFGGGSPTFCYIFEGCSEKEIKQSLSSTITGTLMSEGNVNADTLLVVDITDFEKSNYNVMIEYGGEAYYTVEAISEKEAKAKARQLFKKEGASAYKKNLHYIKYDILL